MKTLVVGGGSAGLVTAIILKKHLNLPVDLVHSPTIGIIGVGEGSTEHFKEFMEFAGISHLDIIKECGATYKSGIMFKDWGSKDYLHNVDGTFNTQYAQYRPVYAKQISEDADYLNTRIVWDSLIPTGFIGNHENAVYNQFHFNTNLLNEYLLKVAASLGVNIYEDDITEVNINESNNITSIKGAKKEYKYDFYVDSTGFKKLLIGKLGGTWESFSKYLPVDSAITFRTGDTDNYNLWTLAQAMKSGWMFRLPVWGSHGNGYIYNSKFITEEEAKQEVEEYFGHEVTIGKKFSFDPGKIDKAWINNCVATGLSSIFVEPLEASSIGATIQQTFLLMHRMVGYNESTINDYNKSFNDIAENIRDFVFLHYITDREDTPFWKSTQTLEVPESLHPKLEQWKTKLPIKEDFNNYSDYILFTDHNFIVVMDGLNLFDRKAISKEYNALNPSVRAFADARIAQKLNEETSLKTITHKEYLRLTREMF
jgi:hypothetical protein